MNDAGKLRDELLRVIQELSAGSLSSGSHQNLQTGTVLGKFDLQFEGREKQQLLLTLWHDLFRTGYLAWGFNINNPNPPFFHLTERGMKSLENFSRDPVNPAGYLAYLAKHSQLNPVAESYLKEALNSYNNDCIKSSVVMVGAAVESIALDLRDAMVTKIKSLGRNPPKDLESWRIKTVLDCLQKEIIAKQKDMPLVLRETFETQWASFVHQIRIARNEAGHPKSIEPVTSEDAHVALLIFPKLAKLNGDLLSWISTSFS
jgi:hypothetical protein